MIDSPARRHFQRMLAQREAKTVDADNKPVGTAYELQKAQLIEHRRALSDIQSIERKIDFKQSILPEYADYIAGVLAADQGANDDVITTLLVWCFDIGDIEQGMTLARYAIKHGLEMPDQYKRSVPAVVAEECADMAMRIFDVATEQLEALQGTYALLLDALDMTESVDMHDQIQAKLFKALGMYAHALEHPQVALSHYQRALELNENVGVKKQIQQLEREIKKAEKAAAE